MIIFSLSALAVFELWQAILFSYLIECLILLHRHEFNHMTATRYSHSIWWLSPSPQRHRVLEVHHTETRLIFVFFCCRNELHFQSYGWWMIHWILLVLFFTVYFLIFLLPYHTKYQVNCLLGWQRTFTSTVFHWSSTTFYFVYWFLNAVHYSDTSAVFFFFFFTETDNLPSFWWWCFDKFGGGRLYCCSRSKEWIKSNSDLMSRFVYNMFLSKFMFNVPSGAQSSGNLVLNDSTRKCLFSRPS